MHKNDTDTSPGPMLYTVRDACRETGLGKTKVWELIRQGVLDSTRIGRRVLVRGDSLRRLAERGA